MSLTEDSLRAIIIMEVLGKPPEHLKETLENISEAIGKEPGVEIKEKKINEPVEMEKKKGFYTSFIEMEVKTEGLMQLIMILFKYMPAHMEIISPEKFKVSNNELGELFNELTRRLHGYDEIARIMQVEKKILERKLKEVLGDKGQENKSEKPDTKVSETEPKEDKK